jgi:ABC-type sugar transport system ATPase subunit
MPGGDAAVLLEAHGVSKRYGSVEALMGVSLDLLAGEVHGICGHNGAGKSTLVRILVGLTKPDEGHLEVEGREVSFSGVQDAQAHGVALVDQELSIVPELSVEENVFLGGIDVPFFHRRASLRRRARELLERVGLEHVRLGAPAGELAIGERQLLEIARLLGRDARVLILDEPTATLSEAEIERVFAAIRQVADQGHSVIFISHHLDEVLGVCDRVSVFRDGQRVATHQVAELDRRSLIELMLGEMSGGVEEPAHRQGGVGPAEPLLRVRDLRVPGRLHSLDLDVRPGEIVGLAGQVGSGTSEALRALAGLIPEASGAVILAGRPAPLGSPRRGAAAGIAYLSNDRQGEGLFLGQSIQANLLATRHDAVSRLGLLRSQAGAEVAGHLARMVGVDATRLRAAVSDLSGGNQQKVLLGRCLDRDGSAVLLLDQPTRGVDVGGRAEIHRLVRLASDSGMAVLVASTELDELLDLADTVVAIFAGVKISTRAHAEADRAGVLADMTAPAEAARV